MRFHGLAALVVACLVSASAARAGTLTSATWTADLGFTGLPLPTPVYNVPVAATGTSTATSVAVSLSVSPFETQFFIPQTPSRPLSLHVRFSLAGPQALTATPAMAAAATGVPGTVIVMTANHVSMGVNASMYVVGVNTLVKVPLSFGVNGQAVLPPFSIIGQTHFMTVDFYGWTAGTVAVTGLTSMYLPAPTPTLTAKGSFALTGMGGGTVTLVSPTKVSIDGALAQRRSASFTTLELAFVPEPSTLLLLAAAGASLALVGSRRPH